MTDETQLRPFHLAFPVDDLIATRKFYCDVIGCTTGRSSDTWIDFNMFGHQVVAHKRQQPLADELRSIVDGKEVPIPHFGIVLDWNDWERLSERLRDKNIEFMIEPYIRFTGQPGEQATLFVRDPSGNAIEFKAFKNSEQLFAC